MRAANGMEKEKEMSKQLLRDHESIENNSVWHRGYGCALALVLLLVGLPQVGMAAGAAAPVPPLNIFQNYFVTGDYVVAGWKPGAPDFSGFAPGTISIPDTFQPDQTPGVPNMVPKGADIVAAYLYWETVEKAKTSFAGQQGFFNGYPITGTILGNLNAPVSWSSGGCAGAANGTTTMRTYRADVRPYLPLDKNPNSPTFGAISVNNTPIPVRLTDSGSNGNTAPQALGATLVLIYRVLNPPTPLNAIVLYDGSYAPGNGAQVTSQSIAGFYQPALNPAAKITHIVGNGQANKGETAFFQGNKLDSLYTASFGANAPAFPGVYGTWDNPTWRVGQYVNGSVPGFDPSVTTSVTPSATGSGCVSWGAMLLSTTVQDSDGDGLLDVWENNNGYTDAVSGKLIALPGANSQVKDLFVEIDYLSNLDKSAGAFAHSHLPKQAALDAVGDAFGRQGINVHFDIGPNIYPGDQYVIQGGTGGNAISEGLLVCNDPNKQTPACPFPGQPAVGWKGSFQFVQNDSTLGKFQPGRAQSYHYVLFGHSLGSPRSFWSALASGLSASDLPQLVKIVNTGTSATVTIQSPAGTVKPGDCPNAAGCTDGNSDRVTISGAAGQPNLNGTYGFSNVHSPDGGFTVIFNITTSGVASGTYQFSNEPQLGVSYLGPTSTSGHSDFGGGGDSAITLGLWGADDDPGCQPDPSQGLTANQTYCSNQTGTIPVQTGTLLHELGHSLALTHGGTYYNDQLNPSLPTYEVNCKPNFVSVMNYLFQVRGFVDGGFDYSDQTLPLLDEGSLDEMKGVGSDIDNTPAKHLTRWYSKPNALDIKLQNTTGGRFAKAHCDGTPLTNADIAEVRVDGAAPGPYSGPLDWNNDLQAPDPVTDAIDVDYNGNTIDSPFKGFSDHLILNPDPTDGVGLQQMSARSGAFGFSQAGGLKNGGGGLKNGGGGIDDDGGGLKNGGGGLKNGGGGLKNGGGGKDQDEDTATATLTAPGALSCSNCTAGSPLLEGGRSVPLTWNRPEFGQIRLYNVWRAVGSFSTGQSVAANLAQFSIIKSVTGQPPATSSTDTSGKNNTTYTYFVTAANKQGAQSGASAPLVVRVKF